MVLNSQIELEEKILEFRNIDKKIVLTQGTWDLLHIGHARYFMEAKRHGDILIVGVDSDEKVRERKGPYRPIVPQEERLEMIAHMKHVDFVIIKNIDDPKWHLTKIIRPDVLIATKETYTPEDVLQLESYCGKVVVLDPQATTSTSAKVRRMQILTAQKFEQILVPKLLKAIEEAMEAVQNEKR